MAVHARVAAPTSATPAPADGKSTFAADCGGRGGGRLPSLTGMRFAAALLVFLFHATYENVFRDPGTNAAFVQLFSKAGWVGVSFFFVLSGFLLTWSARPDDTARRFWRRRAWKIYPSHVLTFAVAVALLAWTGQAVPGAVRNLLLVQTWTPDVDVILSANPVSWSLACEAVFYLAFPLLLRLVDAIRPARLWWWAAGLVTAVLCVPALASALVPAGPDMWWLAISEEHYWFVFAFPPVRALEFVLGMVMARILWTGRWHGPGLPLAGLAVVAGYGVALVVPFAYGMVAATVVPLAWLVTAAAAADLRGNVSPFRTRTLVRLGELSFAFYLSHRLVQMYGHRAVGAERSWDTPAGIGVLLLGLVVTLGLSWLLYTFFERPVTRRMGVARPPATPPPPPPAPWAGRSGPPRDGGSR
ncbi:acyltransferase family protein [Streptomyces sp. NPDC093546]|uniref:acyltransferase family protein n=1 Tax=Streptomyces sp. NPDC093546 TaxID=3366040 RepID=UPI00381FD513